MLGVMGDTYYSVLGVSPTATQRDLRRAYLQLLITKHPDKGGDQRGFEAIQYAYAVLSDPKERIIYDEKLAREQGSSPGKEAPMKAETAFEQRQKGAHWQLRNGVAAYVHGQSSLSESARRKTSMTTIADAGQQSVIEGDAGDLSDRIRNLRARIKSTAEGHDTELIQLLAAAYILRGRHHLAACRFSHAEFDAQEAMDLVPDYDEAHRLLEELDGGTPEKSEDLGIVNDDLLDLTLSNAFH